MMTKVKIKNLNESENNDDEVNDDQYINGDHKEGYIHALPLDVACASQERPSLELIHLITNSRPPLHFLFEYSPVPWIPTQTKTITYLASLLPDDGMCFYQGMCPFTGFVISEHLNPSWNGGASNIAW